LPDGFLARLVSLAIPGCRKPMPMPSDDVCVSGKRAVRPEVLGDIGLKICRGCRAEIVRSGFASDFLCRVSKTW